MDSAIFFNNNIGRILNKYNYLDNYGFSIHIHQKVKLIVPAKISLKLISREMATAAGTVYNKTQEELINNLCFLGMSYS